MFDHSFVRKRMIKPFVLSAATNDQVNVFVN